MISYNWELNDWMSIILQIWDNFYVISLQVLTKKGQNTRRIYQDLRPPTHHSIPRTRKVILHVKIFSLNKKKSNISSSYKNIKLYLFKETASCPLFRL